jgi:hypothetical protein
VEYYPQSQTCDDGDWCVVDGYGCAREFEEDCLGGKRAMRTAEGAAKACPGTDKFARNYDEGEMTLGWGQVQYQDYLVQALTMGNLWSELNLQRPVERCRQHRCRCADLREVRMLMRD